MNGDNDFVGLRKALESVSAALTISGVRSFQMRFHRWTDNEKRWLIAVDFDQPKFRLPGSFISYRKRSLRIVGQSPVHKCGMICGRHKEGITVGPRYALYSSRNVCLWSGSSIKDCIAAFLQA